MEEIWVHSLARELRSKVPRGTHLSLKITTKTHHGHKKNFFFKVKNLAQNLTARKPGYPPRNLNRTSLLLQVAFQKEGVCPATVSLNCINWQFVDFFWSWDLLTSLEMTEDPECFSLHGLHLST